MRELLTLLMSAFYFHIQYGKRIVRELPDQIRSTTHREDGATFKFETWPVVYLVTNRLRWLPARKCYSVMVQGTITDDATGNVRHLGTKEYPALTIPFMYNTSWSHKLARDQYMVDVQSYLGSVNKNL